MSIFKKLAIQHGVAVVRSVDDETGKTVALKKAPVAEMEREAARTNLRTAESVKRVAWRVALRELTNNGRDLHQVLYNLAMGHAEQVRLPDGRVSEPVIPSPEVRRAAASDLLDRIQGKAVTQTEVTRDETSDMEQVKAMTDEQLMEIVDEVKWAAARRKREALSAGDTGQG